MRTCCYKPHDYLPLWLEKAEENYPADVISEFFNAFELPRCRLYLWQMLKWYGREKDEEILFDSADCLLFFEKLICFIEATYLVCQQNMESMRVDGDELSEKDNGSITDLGHSLTSVINIVKNSMDVEKIYLLGKYASQPPELGDEYDLLILIKNGHNRPNDEFESLVHNRSVNTVPVNVSVFQLSKVNEMILKGNYFFSVYCVPEKMIYDAGRIELENPNPKHRLPDLQILTETHAAIMAKANGFVAGAKRFYETKEFSLSGFMLHQAAEHGLNALLQPLMQFRIHTHSLHKLMRMTRRFSLEIFSLFPRDTDVEIRLFQLLQKAYIHARYKDTFELQEEDVVVLLERIELLLQRVGQEFERIITAIKVPG